MASTYHIICGCNIRNNLPGHQVDAALQFGWHTLTNGELLDQAESEGFQLLITADQRIPYQQNLSRRNIAVLIITGNRRRHVSRALTAINDAVNSMSPGEARTLEINAT